MRRLFITAGLLLWSSQAMADFTAIPNAPPAPSDSKPPAAPGDFRSPPAAPPAVNSYNPLESPEHLRAKLEEWNRLYQRLLDAQAKMEDAQKSVEQATTDLRAYEVANFSSSASLVPHPNLAGASSAPSGKDGPHAQSAPLPAAK